MSASLIQFEDLSTEKITWSKRGIIAGVPKIAYFNYDDKMFYLKAPNQRIAYTPKPLDPIKKSGGESSPRAQLPKYGLPVVCENEEFHAALKTLEDRIVDLLFERKDQLFADAKKIKNRQTLMDHYYKSVMYEGNSTDKGPRPPLLNAKLPLNPDTPSKFTVCMHHVRTDEESQVPELVKVDLTTDNFDTYIKGGNTAEMVLRFKGVAVTNKAYPMIEVTHMVIHDREQLPDDEGLYAKEELPDDFLISSVPSLKRQTNEPTSSRAPKRTRRSAAEEEALHTF